MAPRFRILSWPPALIAGLALIVFNGAGAALQLELEATSTRFGALTLERVEILRGERIEIALSGISHAALGPMGDVLARCRPHAVQRCRAGTLTWSPPEATPIEWAFERSGAAVRLHHDADAEIRIQKTGADSATLKFRNLALAWTPAGVRRAAGLSALSGRLDGRLVYAPESTRAAFDTRQLEFDTPDGRFAGAGLAFGLNLQWQPARNGFRAEGEWKSGELLLGPVYLPEPAQPVSANLAATQLDESTWRIDRARLHRSDVLDLSATGRLAFVGAVAIENMDVELAHADLETIWRQGLDSIAASRGWGQLDPNGRLEGRLRIERNALSSLGLRVADAGVEDGAGRLALRGLGAWIEWEADAETFEANASWSDARLFRIPLGPGAFALGSRGDGTLALAEPFRLPVLDGALVVERLEWRDWLAAERQLDLDARLEPVDLGRLTRILGWTEFGGRISGRFPGIRLAGDAFDVQGGLDIDLFGGKARVQDLSIERPFGSLPALAADIEFEALDLEQVTGAFEFGRMLGLLSGHVRDLRLLDWQPVRFDARFETLENSPKRRISQKAVDSISTISGGGGAALSGPLLNLFEDFPYRRAGLGCTLENNVCRMRGLRETEQGGYLILEGRLLPRLDIVGYQRRVDWPRLLAQLAAATANASTD